MKKAFVTGPTGFLGLNLMEQLDPAEWDIVALHLPGENLKYLSRFKANLKVGNILDIDSLLASIPEKVDVVFHIAGDTSTWSKNNDRQYRINVEGTRNMLEASIKKKAGRFICTSSISAFGFHDDSVSEETVSKAMESGVNYHKTKYLAEQEVKRRSAEIESVILNPCNIIGPYDKVGWAQIIRGIYLGNLPGIPPGIGTFAHVKDIIGAHISAAVKPSPGPQYVLGGTQATFKEVFNTIEKMLGKPISNKVLSKTKLRLAMNLFMLKSLFDHKEPLIGPEKYKRLVGKQIIDDSKAVKELVHKKTSLEKMLTDSYKWLEKENLLNGV
jgi:nucleoside-diphosphate-sugar epimerase